MTLENALANFAIAFAAGTENFGTATVRPPQPITEPIPLGAILKEYYARILLEGKTQVSGALLLHLFPLESIDSAQHGWRWVRNNDGLVKENAHWNKYWIVIADHNGDAVIVDDSTTDGTVFGNIGADNFKIADNLAGFFQAMSDIMLLEVNNFNYEVYDDDFNVLPKFLDEVSAIAGRLLGPDGQAGFMKFFFG